jgi:multiple sugar transport system substrate-binding protein
MAGNSMGHRLICVLSVLVLFFLIGCTTLLTENNGSDMDKLLQQPAAPQSKPNKIELRLWSFHTGKEFEFWQTLAQQYEEEHPNIQIKVEFVSSDDYFSGTRLLSAFASGHGPDIFFVSPGTIHLFESANLLQPLTAFFTPQMKADFYPSALDSVTLGHEIYAVPIETELLGLYYNKDMFKRIGLKPPKTWQEMRDAAKQLKTADVSGLTMETYKGVYQSFAWMPFLWQTGSDLVAKDGIHSGLNKKGAVQMYAFFRRMIDDGSLNLHPSRPTTDIGILANGETAMQVSGTWNIRMLETNYADKPIGVVPLPVPEKGQKMTIAGGWKIAVNHYSEHADEAAKFVMWAFAEKPDIPLKWVSDVKFAYSPRKSVMKAGGEFYHRGLRKVFTDQIFGTERHEPQYPAEITNIFTNSLQSLLFGRGEPAAIVDRERSELDTYLMGSKENLASAKP